MLTACGGMPSQVVNKDTVLHGQYKQYCFSSTTIVDSMVVTLVWTDPPAFPGSSKTLVSNLDLVLTGPR